MNYFETNEKSDIQQLYEFNYELNLFDYIKKTKDKSQIDAIVKHKDRTFAVELKHRLIPVSKYKTIMIEDYKYLELLLEYQFNGREPLYINFFHDAVAIFNLNKLKRKPNFRNMDIYSKGYKKKQHGERRYMLDLTDAVIYNYRWNNTTNYS